MARTQKSTSKPRAKQSHRAKLKPPDGAQELEITHPQAAGIDVGNAEHWVAIPAHLDAAPVRSFGCFTAELRELVKWLVQARINTVAMQSTGVYWIPLYDLLSQAGLQVFVVNARDTKNLPGRKTDIQECQWLLKLHTYGLLRNSFRPAEEIVVLRTYWRQRQQHVADAAQAVQRMQKVLTQMNVQLANVISDISGVTGQAIVNAILEGQRDPRQLAQLRDPHVKASPEEVAQSLEGNWRPELLFVLQQEVDSYGALQKKIAECDQQLQEQFQKMEGKADPQQLAPAARNKRPRGNVPRGFDLREEV